MKARCERDLSLRFLGLEIQDGRAIAHTAKSARSAACVEECLGQRGLPNIPLTDQADAANSPNVFSCH